MSHPSIDVLACCERATDCEGWNVEAQPEPLRYSAKMSNYEFLLRPSAAVVVATERPGH